MDIIRNYHEIELFTSKLMDRYFGGMKMGVFDIETLGLNPSTAEMVLAGIMEPCPDGSCQIIQFFAEKREDEKDILDALVEELEKYDYILTYNGKHFDMPFVDKRIRAHGNMSYHPKCYNLDLYLILNGHSHLKSVLANLRQKTVEAYMGLRPYRQDVISGADSIQLYYKYLEAKEPSEKQRLKNKILLHNHDDLLQLYQIFPIILKTNVHRAMSYLGFPVAAQNGWPQLNVSKVRVDYSGLTISGNYGGPLFSYIAYDTQQKPYSCHFDPDGSFQFLLPTDRHKGNQFLNLKYYLHEFHEFLRYPNYINGFLLLINEGTTNYMELNMFVKRFLNEFMNLTNCPL